jgi:hypothetical protein
VSDLDWALCNAAIATVFVIAIVITARRGRRR